MATTVNTHYERLIVEVKDPSREMRELAKQLDQAEGKLQQFNVTSQQTRKGMTRQQVIMQQAGYQIDDFFVQIDGGIPVLRAFNQQASQLAGAFGPGGALFGAFISIASLVAGSLLPNLLRTRQGFEAAKQAADEFTRSLGELTQAEAIKRQRELIKEIENTTKQVARAQRQVTALETAQKQLSDASLETLQTLSPQAFGANVSAVGAAVKRTEKELINARGTVDEATRSLILLMQTYGKLQAVIDSPENPFSRTAEEIEKMQIRLGEAGQQTSLLLADSDIERQMMEAAHTLENTLIQLGQQEEDYLKKFTGTIEQRAEVESIYHGLRLQAEQQFNLQMDAIREAQAEKEERDRARLNQRVVRAEQAKYTAIMGAATAFVSGNDRLAKLMRLSQGALSAYQIYAASSAASALALANPPGPPATAPYAAKILAAGKVQAAAVMAAATANTFAGGGRGAAGAAEGSTGPQTFAPPIDNRQLTTETSRQNEILNELRNWSGSRLIPVEYAREIAESLIEVNRTGGV